MESASPLCDICSIQLSKEDHDYSNLCSNCNEFYVDALPDYTEAFACAAQESHDAVRLLILRQRIDNCHERIADAAHSYDGDLGMHETNLEAVWLSRKAAEVMERLPASFAPWWKHMWCHTEWCKIYEARKEVGWVLPSANTPILQRLAAMFTAEQHKAYELEKKIRLEANEHQVMLAKVSKEMEAVEARLEEKHAKALVEVEARHKREMAEKDRRYTEALAPLLGVRDKMRAECEKKCHDAERRSYAMGYAFADLKWNPVYKAVCEELELVRKEGANHQAGYIRLVKERDELILAQADLRQELDESAEAQAEELAAAQKELSGWYERCMAAQDAAERLSAENKVLKMKSETLLELVGPTQRLMTSNPELFGGEAKGTSSPRPPAIVRLLQVKEEKVEKFLKAFVRPVFRDCAVLPGVEEAITTEGLCIALPGPPLPSSPPPSPLVVPDEPAACGATGCIDCLEAKPKPNYNHPFWPSPITKRFAKHLAKHSGLRSPWHSTDPKTIKTHQDALEYIAKRVNISVETLLTYPMKYYQTTYDPWTLLKGPNAFHMGPAPATWWC